MGRLVCDTIETPSLPARRPSAGGGAVTVRGLLGGKDPTVCSLLSVVSNQLF
jgi:hypothetical protein